jgi:hypothetical protein
MISALFQNRVAVLGVFGVFAVTAAAQEPTPAAPKAEPAKAPAAKAEPAPAPVPAPQPEPPKPAPTPPPPGPYAIDAIKLPEEVSGRVSAVDFAPDGRWMLLSASGEIRLRAGETPAWEIVSEQGLEGASGLYAGDWPKSLFVVHNTGISHLFDSDGDGRIDFVKAVAPVWQYGTIGVLFHGSPALTAAGDLLLPPRVAAGPLAGSILRFPPGGQPVPWVSGLVKVAAPTPGPLGSWLLAGTRAIGTPPADFTAIEVIAPTPDAETVEPAVTVPEETKPPEPAEPKEKAKSKKDATPEPEPVPSPALIAPAVAIRVPAELLTSAPIPPAFPRDEAVGKFGPFSGQGFLAGEASNRLLRFWLEEVDGAWQGGVTDFATIDSPTPGLGFLRFSPDGGDLLAGQNGQLFDIRPAGGPIFAVKTVHLATDGFEVSFTDAVNRSKATDPASWKLSRRSSAAPGAADEPVALDPATTRLIVSADGESVTLQTPLAAGTIYRLDLSAMASESGAQISHGPVWYTLQRLRPLPEPDAPAPSAPEPAPSAPEPAPPAPKENADAPPKP